MLRIDQPRRLDILQASNTISPSIHRGVEEGTVPNNRFSGFSATNNRKRLLRWLSFVETRETVETVN